MWPDRVSNQGSLTYESGTLPTALHGSAKKQINHELSQIKSKLRTRQNERVATTKDS